MSCYQKFLDILKKLSDHGRPAGFYYFDVDFGFIKPFNPKAITSVAAFLLIFAFVSVHSFLIHYGNISQSVFLVVPFGFLIKGVVQATFFIAKRDKFLSFIKKIESFNEIAIKLDCNELFCKYYGYMHLVFKVFKYVYFFTGILTMLNPIFIKLAFDEVTLPYVF